MIKYEVYYNQTYAHSANLIKQVIKGHYLHIDQVNKHLIIDNVIIADLKDINEIRFLTQGYYQNIHIAEPNATIKATDIEIPATGFITYNPNNKNNKNKGGE